MANRKISALAAKATPISTDAFLLLDTATGVSDADKNKQITYANVLGKAPNGTAGAPSISFANSTALGLFRSADNELGFAAAGSQVAKITATGLQLGTGTATGQLHLFSSSLANEQLIIENTEAGAVEGPNIVLFRNSASPADNDVLGSVVYRGENSAGGPEDYAEIRASIVDQTNSEEDGKLEFQTISGGTVGTRMVVNSANVGINETSPDNLLHITSSVAGAAVKIECTEASAASGADLLLTNTRGAAAGVANDEISSILFQSNNAASTPESIQYAEIVGGISDPTDGSEDGKITFNAQVAGTNTALLTLDSTHATFGKPVVLSQGSVPTASNSPGVTGEIAWNTSYLYICVSGGTPNGTWKRILLDGDW